MFDCVSVSAKSTIFQNLVCLEAPIKHTLNAAAFSVQITLEMVMFPSYAFGREDAKCHAVEMMIAL